MNKLLGMLGICMKAGKLVSGSDSVIKLIRSGKAKVAVIDAAASANAFKSINNACITYKVPLIQVSAGALGDQIGKPGRMLAATSDEGFANRILELSREA